MAQAKKGDQITINYTGTLDDGSIFDSTLEAGQCDDESCSEEGCEEDDCGCGGHAPGPVSYILGEAVLFPQIDDAIVGMAPGEKRTVKIAAADAFGEYDQERVFTVPRADLPEDLDPVVGDELVLSNEDDEELGVCILEVSETEVVFDANHPLAGEDLTFEVELVSLG